LLVKPGELGVGDYFGFDRHMRTRIPVYDGPIPSLGPKIISDEGENLVIVDEWGVKQKMRKRLGTIPQFLEFPVKTTKDWEEMKKRFDPRTRERYPKNWKVLVQAYKRRDYPLSLFHIYGFFHLPRTVMGLHNLLTAYYRDPELLLNIADFWCEFLIELAKKSVEEVEIDWVTIGEDMAYKGRSMISPEIFRKFMLPYYKRLTKFLRQYGIDVIFVDSDGYVHDLIPLWMEGGVNGTWPLEVIAGNDPVALREKYGKSFILSGGINKYALVEGPNAIKKELTSKLPYLISCGGYIPSVDHMVPPDVSLANFKYYAELKTRIIKNAASTPI
jgi:uroporphyrinogen decarboxylase